GPVGVDLEPGRACGIVSETIETQRGDPLLHGRDLLREGKRRVDGGEEERAEALQLDSGQIVSGGGEIADALELRHGEETPVQAEAAAVVAAPQRLRRSLLGTEKVAAMGADVRECSQDAGRVPGEQARLTDRRVEN